MMNLPLNFGQNWQSRDEESIYDYCFAANIFTKNIVKWRGIGSGGGAEWWACNGTGSIAINLGGYEDAIPTASRENSPMNIHQYRKGMQTSNLSRRDNNTIEIGDWCILISL